jgi:dynein heavy chain, axonemal
VQGNVETWLNEVEERMSASVRNQCLKALKAYVVTERTKWVLQWPAMVAISVAGVFWAKGVEDGVVAGNMHAVLDKNTNDLMGLTELVRGELSAMDRMTLGALITIDVHARDVVADLAEHGLTSIGDFEWVKQLRYYWRDDLFVDMVQVRPLALACHSCPCVCLSPVLHEAVDFAGVHCVWVRVLGKHSEACNHPTD